MKLTRRTVLALSTSTLIALQGNVLAKESKPMPPPAPPPAEAAKAALPAEPAKDAPGPRMVVEQEVFDAGQVVRGAQASATFVIKNEGTEPLKILSAKPGCGCTVASFDELIEPGGTGKVAATVKTEGFRGKIEKAVTVTSNDPAHPAISLRVKAEVVGSVEFIPRPGLAFPEGMDWDWSSKVIVRKDRTESGDLNLTEVTPNVPWLKTVATKVTEPVPAADGIPEALPGDYILEVTVTDEAPRTQGGFTIKMKTGLTREPEVTFPVSVVNQQPMRPVPNALYLQAPKPNEQEVVATIEALLRPGIPKDQPLTATVSPEPFTVAVEPDGPRKYKATVRWKPGKDRATALRQGAVVLHLGEESMTVPVRIDPDPPAASMGAALVPGGATKP